MDTKMGKGGNGQQNYDEATGKYEANDGATTVSSSISSSVDIDPDFGMTPEEIEEMKAIAAEFYKEQEEKEAAPAQKPASEMTDEEANKAAYDELARYVADRNSQFAVPWNFIGKFVDKRVALCTIRALSQLQKDFPLPFCATARISVESTSSRTAAYCHLGSDSIYKGSDQYEEMSKDPDKKRALDRNYGTRSGFGISKIFTEANYPIVLSTRNIGKKTMDSLSDTLIYEGKINFGNCPNEATKDVAAIYNLAHEYGHVLTTSMMVAEPRSWEMRIHRLVRLRQGNRRHREGDFRRRWIQGARRCHEIREILFCIRKVQWGVSI